MLLLSSNLYHGPIHSPTNPGAAGSFRQPKTMTCDINISIAIFSLLSSKLQMSRPCFQAKGPSPKCCCFPETSTMAPVTALLNLGLQAPLGIHKLRRATLIALWPFSGFKPQNCKCPGPAPRRKVPAPNAVAFLKPLPWPHSQPY